MRMFLYQNIAYVERNGELKKIYFQIFVIFMKIFQLDAQYIPFEGVTKCCNEHDLCYGFCNKDKEKCDLDFKRCLYSICDNLKSKTSDVITTGK